LSEEQQEPKSYQQQVYDTSFKSLLQNQTVEKLNFFVEGIESARELSEKALKPSLNVDGAYLIYQNRVEKVLHVEFETDPASDMPHRMHEYCGILFRKYKKTIISLVACPFRTSIADPPLVMLDEGKESLVFHHRVMRLWQYQAYKMLEQHLVFLYALLPTMENANYEVLAQALEEMKEYYQGQPRELSTHLLWFDTLLWRTDTVSPEDQRRVKTKMEQLDDLLEQSPYVQKKKEEGREIGREEGREIGREEGHEEGLAEGLQKAFVTFVQGRFPPLAELAQQRVSQVTEPDKLDLLLRQIVTIPDETTARWLLNTIAA
jgi:predicted transposase YdaD